jgi:hypothetical protein
MPFQLQVTASRRFRPARLLIGEFGSEVFSAPLHFPTIDIVGHVLWLRLVAADSSVGAFGCSPVSKAGPASRRQPKPSPENMGGGGIDGIGIREGSHRCPAGGKFS